MKVLIIINDVDNSCEQVILSRELSSEELSFISSLVGNGRTVHYSDCPDKPIPFNDITEVINTFLLKVAES